MIKSNRYENSKKDFDYNDGFMISFTPAQKSRKTVQEIDQVQFDTEPIEDEMLNDSLENIIN
jgi:hypothetical protein